MTPEEENSFIAQVGEVIQQQQASEDYLYYNHFFNEAQKYGLSEVDFNKRILVKAFQAYTGPVAVTTGNSTPIFGKKCYTLAQMGEQFFNYPAKSELYMDDAILFKEDVRKLENSDVTMELVQLFNSETIITRRYLRMVYHLNPRLPFRIGAELSANIDNLLQKGFQDYNFYEQIINSFSAGYLQIWLQETDKENAAKWNGGVEYNDFLYFIYAVNRQYPFYIKEEIFATPADVVARAQHDGTFWEVLYQYLKTGKLQAWFTGLRKPDWNEKQEAQLQQIAALKYYNSPDKKQAAVQAMLHIIDPALPVPQVTADMDKVSLLSIEASAPVQQLINFKLQNTGILKGVLNLSNAIEGISINKSVLSFNSFQQQVNEPVLLTIEPSLLQKDQVYQTAVLLTTPNGVLTIPVEIKATFPEKAYKTTLLKYACSGAVYFVLIRLLISLFNGSSRWLPKYVYGGELREALPGNYYVYIIVLLVTIITSWVAWLQIKRIEKL